MVLIWGLRGDLVLVDQFGFCVWLHWYSIFSKSPTNVSKSSKTIKNVKPPSSPFTFYVASSFSLQFSIMILIFPLENILFCDSLSFLFFFFVMTSPIEPQQHFKITGFLFHSLQFSNSLLILCFETLSFFYVVFIWVECVSMEAILITK